MKRSAFKAKPREGPDVPREPKPRANDRIVPQIATCEMCPREFTKHTTLHTVCSQRCAMKKQKVAADAKVAKEKADLKARKEAIKPLSHFKAKAQAAFNEYIRLRDARLGCVSCDTTNPPMLPGGQWDAGHFLSRGAYPELAFNEDNCHKQCKPCNAGSGKFSAKARTVAERFEAELVERIGKPRLAALKGFHPAAKRTREDFEALTVYYKRKAKELKERKE